MPTGTSAARRAKTASGPGLRGELARAEILRAGKAVFERVGYVDARVSDIVKEAGKAQGSFYTYFPSKREIFIELLRRIGSEINDAVAHGPEDVERGTVQNLENANRRYLSVYRKHMKLMVLYDQLDTIDPVIHEMRTAGRIRHIARVSETIDRLQERGIADADLDAQPTAAALVSMLASFAYWSSQLGYDEETTATTVTRIWARTLGFDLTG